MSIWYIKHVPKKTKQEKIIADLRRQLEATNSGTISWTPTKEVKAEPKTIKQKMETPPLRPSRTTEPLLMSTALIKKDLLKTLILSLLAVSFELVLYFKLQH